MILTQPSIIYFIIVHKNYLVMDLKKKKEITDIAQIKRKPKVKNNLNNLNNNNYY